MNKLNCRGISADAVQKTGKKRIGLLNRLILWRGVTRRFFIFFFRKSYIEKKLLTRSGSCRQCGACCRLLRNCPSLAVGSDGKYICVNHQSFRMHNCKIFPIDYRDINDRNIVMEEPCGFCFNDDRT